MGILKQRTNVFLKYPDKYPDDYWCDLCSHVKDGQCGCQDEYVCTRPRGHKGNHAACGIDKDEHPIAQWPQKRRPNG
jgi:hypothetical protein